MSGPVRFAFTERGITYPHRLVDFELQEWNGQRGYSVPRRLWGRTHPVIENEGTMMKDQDDRRAA